MEKRMKNLKRWIRTELGPLLLLVLLLFAGRSSLADHYFVPSGSMEHTLYPGDRVIVDKTAYGVRLPFTKIDLVETGRPQAGQVAVFDSPDTGVLLIKRIVAVGGDRVDLVAGRLWVNGARLAQTPDLAIEKFGDRSANLNLEFGGGPDIHGMLVPDGMVLVLGDNRGNSRDGRFFGLVPEREFYGRAIAVYYSKGAGFRWQPL